MGLIGLTVLSSAGQRIADNLKERKKEVDEVIKTGAQVAARSSIQTRTNRVNDENKYTEAANKVMQLGITDPRSIESLLSGGLDQVDVFKTQMTSAIQKAKLAYYSENKTTDPFLQNFDENAIKEKFINETITKNYSPDGELPDIRDINTLARAYAQERNPDLYKSTVTKVKGTANALTNTVFSKNVPSDYVNARFGQAFYGSGGVDLLDDLDMRQSPFSVNLGTDTTAGTLDIIKTLTDIENVNVNIAAVQQAMEFKNLNRPYEFQKLINDTKKSEQDVMNAIRARKLTNLNIEKLQNEIDLGVEYDEKILQAQLANLQDKSLKDTIETLDITIAELLVKQRQNNGVLSSEDKLKLNNSRTLLNHLEADYYGALEKTNNIQKGDGFVGVYRDMYQENVDSIINASIGQFDKYYVRGSYTAADGSLKTGWLKKDYTTLANENLLEGARVIQLEVEMRAYNAVSDALTTSKTEDGVEIRVPKSTSALTTLSNIEGMIFGMMKGKFPDGFSFDAENKKYIIPEAPEQPITDTSMSVTAGTPDWSTLNPTHKAMLLNSSGTGTETSIMINNLTKKFSSVANYDALDNIQKLTQTTFKDPFNASKTYSINVKDLNINDYNTFISSIKNNLNNIPDNEKDKVVELLAKEKNSNISNKVVDITQEATGSIMQGINDMDWYNVNGQRWYIMNKIMEILE